MSNVILMGNLQRNYTQLDNNILYDDRLKSNDKCIYWYLIEWAKKDTTKPVTQRGISKDLHLSTKTVNLSLERLKDAGIVNIETKKARGENGKTTTVACYYVQAVDVTCKRMVNKANNEQSLDNMAEEYRNYGMSLEEKEQQEMIDQAIAELEQADQVAQQSLQEPVMVKQVQTLADDNPKAVQGHQESRRAICGIPLEVIKETAHNKGIYSNNLERFINGLAEYQERANNRKINQDLLNAIADKFGNDSKTNIVEELIQYQAL